MNIPPIVKDFYTVREAVESALAGRRFTSLVIGFEEDAVPGPVENKTMADQVEKLWIRTASEITGHDCKPSHKAPDVDAGDWGVEVKAEEAKNTGFASLVDIVDLTRESPIILNSPIHKSYWGSTESYSEFNSFLTVRPWEVSRLLQNGSRMATVQNGSPRLAMRARRPQEPGDWIAGLLNDYQLYRPEVTDDEMEVIRKDVGEVFTDWCGVKTSF